jgi:hypothetical protein
VSSIRLFARVDDDLVSLEAIVDPIRAGGRVEFFDGSISLGISHIKMGRAELLTQLEPGAHSIWATYHPPISISNTVIHRVSGERSSAGLPEYAQRPVAMAEMKDGKPLLTWTGNAKSYAVIRDNAGLAIVLGDTYHDKKASGSHSYEIAPIYDCGLGQRSETIRI